MKSCYFLVFKEFKKDLELTESLFLSKVTNWYFSKSSQKHMIYFLH